MSTDITMFYYHIRLCISLAKNRDLFLKTVSIVSLSFHLVIKGRYSLTTTNYNFKTSKTSISKIGYKQNQTAYSSDSYRHHTENTDVYWWNTLIPKSMYMYMYTIVKHYLYLYIFKT